VLGGLGELEAPLDSPQAPLPLLAACLLSGAQRSLPLMAPGELARLLRGLARAGLAWKGLSADLHWALAAALHTHAGRMTPPDLV